MQSLSVEACFGLARRQEQLYDSQRNVVFEFVIGKSRVPRIYHSNKGNFDDRGCRPLSPTSRSGNTAGPRTKHVRHATGALPIPFSHFLRC